MSIDRIDLVNTQPHWLGYQCLDISLDCFPHNAGTTTLESLWMGVPVLTKLDRPSVGRIGASILIPLGLEDWVANDDKEYIEKAVSFSQNIVKLKNLRRSLRSRIEQNAISQPKILAEKFEQAYQEILMKHFLM